jgi:hypothetical protein
MVLSFLYLAFVRVVQLVRLSCRAQDDLAIEVVMVRHEVAVRRRLVDRPALRPADRALLAGLNDFSHGPAAEASSSSRPRCCAGTETSCDDAGPTHTADPVNAGSLQPPPPSSSDWHVRTRPGAIGASMASL